VVKKIKARKKPWVVLFLKIEKPYLSKEWLKVDQLLQQVVAWSIQVDAKKPNSTSKEVIMDKIWSKWNSLNKKGKMIVGVVAVVILWAVYNHLV